MASCNTKEVCIICTKSLTRLKSKEGEAEGRGMDLENVEVKNHTNNTVSTDSNQKEARDDNAIVEFFLSKFLKYELIAEEDINDFIGLRNLKDYIGFCPSCLEWVLEARKLHVKITELQEELESYRKLAEDKVVDTCTKNDVPNSTDIRNQNPEDLYRNIRQTICRKQLWMGLGCTVGMDSEPPPEVDPLLVLPEKVTRPEEIIFKKEPEDTVPEDNEELAGDNWPGFNHIVIEPDNASAAAYEDDHPLVPPQQQKRRHGRPKSSALSRTCNICNLVFDRPRDKTRHFTECHLDQNVADRGDSGDYNNSLDDSHQMYGNETEDGDDDFDIHARGKDSDADYNYENDFSDGDNIEDDWDAKIKRKYAGPSKVVLEPGSGPGRKKSNGESRTCPICKRIFDRPHRMRRHLNSQHYKKEQREAVESNVKLNPSVNAKLEEDQGEANTCIITDDDPFAHNSKRGPKKSSTASRTCKICKRVFNKPSRMMLHLKSSHNAKKRLPLDQVLKIDGNQEEIDQRTDRLENIQITEHTQVRGHDKDDLQEVKSVAKDEEKSFIKRFEASNQLANQAPEAIGGRRKLKLVNYQVSEGGDGDFIDTDAMDTGKGDEDCEFSCRNSDYEESDADNRKLAKPVKARVKKKADSNESEIQDLTNSFESRICPICKQLFDDSQGVDEHLKSVHEKSENEIFFCHICGKRFVGVTSLKLHMECHDKKGRIINKRTFKCSFEGCEWAFKTSRDLVTHENRHTGAKDYLCSLCGATFGHRSSFLRHKTICSNTSTPYACQICGKRFKTTKYLDQHLSSKYHGGPGNTSQHRRRDFTATNVDALTESTYLETTGDHNLVGMNV